MFDQVKKISALLRQGGELKEAAGRVLEDLATRTVVGEAGGGAVRAHLNGHGRVVRIELNAPLLEGLAGSDKAAAEELIATAVNQAMDRVREMAVEEFRKLSGGLEIPGLRGLLGKEP